MSHQIESQESSFEKVMDSIHTNFKVHFSKLSHMLIMQWIQTGLNVPSVLIGEDWSSVLIKPGYV